MLFDLIGIVMLVIIAMTPFLCIYSFKLGFNYGKGEPEPKLFRREGKAPELSEEDLAHIERIQEIDNFEFGEHK